MLPYNFSHASFRFLSRFSSICLILFCNWTQAILWFYWTAEPSTLTRRAFAIATPKARRFDNEPSATSWIQRSGSVYPKIRFWKSPNSLQRNHTCASVNSLKSFSQSPKALHQKHSMSWMCRFYITICYTCLCFAKNQILLLIVLRFFNKFANNFPKF